MVIGRSRKLYGNKTNLVLLCKYLSPVVRVVPVGLWNLLCVSGQGDIESITYYEEDKE